MNLLSINLLSCFLLPTLGALDLLRPSAISGALGESSAAGVLASSAVGVLCVAADQYRAVLRPLTYHGTRPVHAAIASWLAGAVAASAALPGEFLFPFFFYSLVDAILIEMRKVRACIF